MDRVAWLSMYTPQSLTSRVMTLANRLIPRLSFQASRAGKLTAVREFARLLDRTGLGVSWCRVQSIGSPLRCWKCQVLYQSPDPGRNRDPSSWSYARSVMVLAVY